MSQAEYIINVDNDRVRVTTWTFSEAGKATGQHRHEFDYVVVPITGGLFEVLETDGSSKEMDQVAGTAYMGKAGTEHDVICRAEATSIFVEIELK